MKFLLYKIDAVDVQLIACLRYILVSQQLAFAPSPARGAHWHANPQEVLIIRDLPRLVLEYDKKN